MNPLSLPNINKYVSKKNFKNPKYWEAMDKLKEISHLTGESFGKLRSLTKDWTYEMISDAYQATRQNENPFIGFYTYRKKTLCSSPNVKDVE